MSKFLDYFKTKGRSDKGPQDKIYFNQLLFGSSQVSAQEQNDKNYIKRGYQGNPTVFSIINMVAKNAGMAKWGVYKKGADNTKEPYKDVLLQGLLETPNGLQTWNELIQNVISFKLITGNSYIWGIDGENTMTKGKTAALYTLPSDRVQIHANDSNTAIRGYSVDFYGRGNKDVIPATEILHLKNFNPLYNGDGDFLYGQSPLKATMQSLYTNNDAIETSGSYLKNQGPRGLLSIEPDDTYGKLSEDETNAMRARWRAEHTGVKKAGELLIVPGKPQWHEIGSTSADLKLIEHYKLTVNDICNVYQFPTILISDGDSTFSNQKEAKKMLWTNVIIPALTEIRDGLNAWLVPKFGEGICIDFDLTDIKELQEDIKSQAEAINKLQGVVTVNEARAMINKAPLAGPEGDELYIFQQGVVDEKPSQDAKE